MTPYLLAYLTIGALLNIVALIVFRRTRREAIAYLLYRPASRDPFIVGAEFIGRLLVSSITCASTVVFWPLVWVPLLVGQWRLKKEKCEWLEEIEA